MLDFPEKVRPFMTPAVVVGNAVVSKSLIWAITDHFSPDREAELRRS